MFLREDQGHPKILQQIQSLGVQLAMDDFGTGYSSLGYLRRTPFDTLKIDRSFVSSISAQDPESTAIIRAVVALAGSLGMKTAPKGSRPRSSSSWSAPSACDKIQGYIFSRPVTSNGQGDARPNRKLGRRPDSPPARTRPATNALLRRRAAAKEPALRR